MAANDVRYSRRSFLALGAAFAAGCAAHDEPPKPGPGPGAPGSGPPPQDLSKLSKQQHYEVWKQRAGTPYEVGSTKMPGVCHLPGPNKKVKFPDPDKYKGTTQVHGMCQLCSTVCGITGHVKDGRIIKVDGNPNDPSSRGRLCARGQAALNHQYHPERLLYPLKRTGPRGSGQWMRITWDEAYTTLAGRIRALVDAKTPELFAFHQGRNRSPDIISGFLNAVGTPTHLNHRALCSAAIRAANLTGLWETDWDLGDFERTKYILNFGANVFEAHQGHVAAAQRVQRGRFENGAKLVTFDVRCSNTAGNSDEHYMPFPGTDGAVALAMCNVIVAEKLGDQTFFETWSNTTHEELWAEIKDYTPAWAEKVSTIKADVIARIAREFAAAAPTCTTLSNRGTTAHLNGYYNNRAVLLLNVLVGNLGKPGGLCWMFTGETDAKRFAKPKSAPAPKKYSALADPPQFVLSNVWNPMKVGEVVFSMLEAGQAKVDTFMSYNLDAPVSWPEAERTKRVFTDEKLIPFHVSINPFYNETAHFADMILPWTTYLERWDVDARGAYNLKPYLSMRRPMTAALGEAKDLREIFPELARRIGGEAAKWFPAEQTVEKYMEEWVKDVPFDAAKYSSPMQYLAAVGAFEDPKEKPYYQPYLKALKPEALEGSTTDPATGIISNKEGLGIGIMVDGKAVVGFKTPSRKYEVKSEYLAKLGANEDTAELAKRANSKAKNRPAEHKAYSYVLNPWPTYMQIDEHLDLPDDRLVMTSFKWNVHNNMRTANLKWLSEIVHSNPAWLHPDTAQRYGLADGDWIAVTAYRSKLVERVLPSLGLGSEPVVGTLEIPVFLTRGIHRRAIAISTSLGHFQYSNVALARKDIPPEGPAAGMDLAGQRDADWERNMWWADRSNGDRSRFVRNTGNGWLQNSVMPINPDFVTGQQSFNDTVVSIRKL